MTPFPSEINWIVVCLSGQHAYLMGLQHRQTGDSETWVPTKDSNVYWLQNSEASMMWPATAENVNAVMAAFVAQPASPP
jgi:hypothetical protein